MATLPKTKKRRKRSSSKKKGSPSPKKTKNVLDIDSQGNLVVTIGKAKMVQTTGGALKLKRKSRSPSPLIGSFKKKRRLD